MELIVSIGATIVPDLNGFVIYAKVVELGGFTAAARALGLSKSVISRQVSALEDELGTRLLNRTTRRISMTEAGAAVLERAQRIVAEAEAAAGDALSTEGLVRGHLRINAPMSFGIRQLGPVMPEFMARYPDLTVEVILNDRRVDLIEEGFDVSLRISALADSSLIARQLAPVERYIVGAPSYFEAHGVPRHPTDLTAHQFLLYSLMEKPGRLEFADQSGKIIRVEVGGRFHCNNSDTTQHLLYDGVGLALTPDFICMDGLRSGKLKRILMDWTLRPVRLHVIYPHARHLAPKVRAFVDFAAEKFDVGKAPWTG